MVLSRWVEEERQDRDRSVSITGGAAQAKESVLRIGPRRIRHIHAVLIEPGDIENAWHRLAQAMQKMTRPQGGMLLAHCNELRDEARQFTAFESLRHRPIQPRNLVILAIGIVVAALRASELVTGEQHRGPVRK